MRFQRFPHHKARGITPRRLAASKRKLQKERDKFPLLKDWVAEQQPTPEERILTIDDATVDYFQNLRDDNAKSWRESRNIFYSLEPDLRKKIRKAWANSSYPGDGVYFKLFIKSYLKNRDVYE